MSRDQQHIRFDRASLTVETKMHSHGDGAATDNNADRRDYPFSNRRLRAPNAFCPIMQFGVGP